MISRIVNAPYQFKPNTSVCNMTSPGDPPKRNPVILTLASVTSGYRTFGNGAGGVPEVDGTVDLASNNYEFSANRPVISPGMSVHLSRPIPEGFIEFEIDGVMRSDSNTVMRSDSDEVTALLQFVNEKNEVIGESVLFSGLFRKVGKIRRGIVCPEDTLQINFVLEGKMNAGSYLKIINPVIKDVGRSYLEAPGFPVRACYNPAYFTNVTIADMNNDCLPEIVTMLPIGLLNVTNGFGMSLPNFPLWVECLGGADTSWANIHIEPLVDDLEGRGKKTILVHSGISREKLYGINENGEILFRTDLRERPGGPLLVSDINNDGFKEIVNISEGGTLTLLDHKGSRIWEKTIVMPSKQSSIPVVCEMKGDGTKTIVLASQGFVHAYDKDGNEIFRKVLSQKGLGGYSFVSADIDFDGKDEAVCVDYDNENIIRVFKYDGTETMIPTSDTNSVIYSPSLYFENNSYNLVFANRAGQLSNYNFRTGEMVVMDNPGKEYFVPSRLFGSPALADVNNDASVDAVIAGFRDPVGQYYPLESLIFGFSKNGQQAGRFPALTRYLPSESVVLADINGDNKLEAVFLDWLGDLHALQLEGSKVNKYAVPWARVRHDNSGTGNYNHPFSIYLPECEKAPVEPCPSCLISPELFQNYPNPFNNATTIQFFIPQPLDMKQVNVRVFDILGRPVRNIFSGSLQTGTYNMIWNGLLDDGTKASAGTYLCRLSTEGFIRTKQMILLK